MDRPQLGQRIRAKDRLIRHSANPSRPLELGWIRSSEQYLFSKLEPFEGIFAGTRTYTTGICHWNGENNEWEVLERYEVWLILYHIRFNPVPVWPEDCELI
jgi:hypothetical protein